MPKLDTNLVRRNLAQMQSDFAAFPADPERYRDCAGRLSRLASEITAACEQAFSIVRELPAGSAR